MKKIFTLLLTIISLLAFCSITMAQIHAKDGDRRTYNNWDYTDIAKTTDTWYTVEPQEPTFEVDYHCDPNNSELGIEKYINDQTFFDIANDGTTYLAGSYLFEGGLFIGGSYDGGMDHNTTLIAPGYRFSIDEKSFIALSVDYQTSSATSDDNGIKDYDLYFKFYGNDLMKFSCEVIAPTEDDQDNYWWAGMNLKTSDHVTVGAYYESDDDNYIGFTYTSMPLIIDAEIGQGAYNNVDNLGIPTTVHDNYYTVSGMFQFGDSLRLGGDYIKFDDFSDGAVHIKLNYGTDKANYILKYRLRNDTYDARISAVYNAKL